MAKTAARKPLDAVEEEARQVVQAYLGVPVVQHDDNSAQAMPDLRIEYPDRPHAVVEVVRDVLQARAGQRAAIDQRGGVVLMPGHRKSWGVYLNPAASVRAVHSALPELLAQAEQIGANKVQALQYSGVDPLGYRLFQLKIEMLTALPVGPSGPMAVLYAPNTFTWNGDAEVITRWSEALLHQEDDVPAKLLGSGFDERHAYLVPTAEGDLMIYRVLFNTPPGGGDPVLPMSAPSLPNGVDRLWVRGLDRVLMWSPDTSWVSVAKSKCGDLAGALPVQSASAGS